MRLFQLYFKADDSPSETYHSKTYASWDADVKEVKGMPSDGYKPIASGYFILHEENTYCLKNAIQIRLQQVRSWDCAALVFD